MGQALVRSSSRHGATEGTSQYLTFTLGSELLAVRIGVIREVIELPCLTRIPLTPAEVPGVLNLRGAVIPVIDLAARLGRGPTVFGRRTCVMIVELADAAASAPLGVIVDTVSEALEVAGAQVEERPAFGAGLRPDFVAEMLNLAGRFVVVLDMEQVLSLRELEQLVTDATQGQASLFGTAKRPQLPAAVSSPEPAES